VEAFRQATEGRAADQSARALGESQAPWTFEVRDGDPAAQLELVGRERGADLIVVGACTHTAMYRLRLGSVSNWLVHHADRPVLIVRSRCCELRQVLVGVDAHDPGAEAAGFAGRLAKETGPTSLWHTSATSRPATPDRRS